MKNIDKLNKLAPEEAFNELFKCCGSSRWAKALSSHLPFENKHELLSYSDHVWSNSTKEDGLEAFSHHPKIGDLKDLEKKFSATKEWAGNEQAGVNQAKLDTLKALAKGNEAYELRFGYIFIVCATGKSAEEMLDLLNQRINNDPETEFQIAMNEQNKITKIRLEKLLS